MGASDGPKFLAVVATGIDKIEHSRSGGHASTQDILEGDCPRHLPNLNAGVSLKTCRGGHHDYRCSADTGSD